MNISAVILAGGKSRRMGQDKAWLTYRSRTLVEQQLHTLRRLQPMELFISGPAEPRLAALGAPLLTDNFPGQGPLAGIERALEVMRAPLLLTLAVDMPEMSAGLLRRLIRKCKDTVGVVPRLASRVEPLAAIYPKAAHRAVLTLLGNGNNSATWFAELCVELGLAIFQDFEGMTPEFANWNTPGDVRRRP